MVTEFVTLHVFSFDIYNHFEKNANFFKKTLKLIDNDPIYKIEAKYCLLQP